jgi:hypothetical protein
MDALPAPRVAKTCVSSDIPSSIKLTMVTRYLSTSLAREDLENIARGVLRRHSHLSKILRRNSIDFDQCIGGNWSSMIAAVTEVEAYIRREGDRSLTDGSSVSGSESRMDTDGDTSMDTDTALSNKSRGGSCSSVSTYLSSTFDGV